MSQTATKPKTEDLPEREVGTLSMPDASLADSREWQVERLRLLWGRRQFFLRAAGIALAVSTLIAFLIPKQYTSTAQLMPPDTQSTSGMAMMAAFAAKGGGLGSVAGDLLGMKSTGALFIGVLRSQTSQERLVQQFDLRHVYGTALIMDARMRLDQNTSISEDRKSGIITISVTDHDSRRAAALATAYVDELNSLVAELSTSAAHRERIFLEERLKIVKEDLDTASNELAQFSSKNNTIDIQQEGKAIVEAAANLAGQMIAAQSQLEGLRQIYTDSNPRVQSLNARVGELRKQLQKIGGTGPGAAKDLARGTDQTSDRASDQASDQASEMPYPSIRNLPLLGVKYADHFRHAKIQETVYELLTQQYELAKVQEAKETPSVKVLDPARIPEKKSFPPRLVIMLLGMFIGVAVSTVWVLASAQWDEVDPQDPRKVFAQEVAGAVKARLPWTSRNGFAAHAGQEAGEDELDGGDLRTRGTAGR